MFQRTCTVYGIIFIILCIVCELIFYQFCNLNLGLYQNIENLLKRRMDGGLNEVKELFDAFKRFSKVFLC